MSQILQLMEDNNETMRRIIKGWYSLPQVYERLLKNEKKLNVIEAKIKGWRVVSGGTQRAPDLTPFSEVKNDSSC